MKSRIRDRGTCACLAVAAWTLAGSVAFAQTPACNGTKVYPCSIGGTLLVVVKPTGYLFNFGSGGSGGTGGTGVFINDPQNPGFSATTVTPVQAVGPVLPSLTGATFSLASANAQPTIVGVSASITCGVTGAATYSMTVSTPGDPIVLNCPKVSTLGATASVTSQVVFAPLSSLAVTFTLSGTAPTSDDRLAVGAISAQVQIPSPGCSPTLSFGGQAFPPMGGSGSIDITAGPGCGWNVSNMPSWVTITTAGSGTGNGTVSYQVAPNTSNDRTATMLVANTSFNLEQEAPAIPGLSFIGSMPHLAAQGGWSMIFTLVNKTAAPLLTRPSLFADSGNPLSLPLTFPQQPPAGPLLGATIDRTLAANASLIVQAPGSVAVPVQTGSGQLAATGPPGSSADGFAIFRFNPTAQEAAVPLETRNASSYVLAFDNTNSVVLGVALENVSPLSATIPVILRDDLGNRIGTGSESLSLAGNGHLSFVLPTQFPLTANLRGTIEFDRPPDGQISVLGIRFTPPGTLTTVPALTSGTGGGLAAHVASGNGWETTFVLVNLSATAQTAALKFFDNFGNPLLLPLVSAEGGLNIPPIVPFLTLSIPPGASQWLRSVAPSPGPLLTGSAQLTGNVNGFVIFRYDPSGQEAVVPLESRNAGTYLLAFDNTGSTATGVAISTISALPTSVPVLLRNAAGTQIGPIGAISLAASGHSSFDLATQFPATANIRGVVEFQTPMGAQISVLGIRSPPTLTFTTLPALAK